MVARFSLLMLAAWASGCATARLAQEASFTPPDTGVVRTVVVEPLFELADWQTSTRTEYAQVPLGSTMDPRFSSLNSGWGGGFPGAGYGPGWSGSGFGNTVALTRQVQEKPLFARPDVLQEIHRQVLAEVQRRRPSWRVSSTAGAPVLSGPLTVVRTVIEGNQTLSSDRALKSMALGFGFVILPLQLVHIDPVHETERVYGILERFDVTADALKARLVKYPSQPDFAVNLSGFPPLRRQFGLDVSYTEGVLASEAARPGVLINGFVDRLAAAIVAVVEEPAPGPTPPATAAGVREGVDR